MIPRRRIWARSLRHRACGWGGLGGPGQPGDLDGSFGTTGHAVADFGGSELRRAMVLQEDRKVAIAGFTTNGVGGKTSRSRGWVRGALDDSFGKSGHPRPNAVRLRGHERPR